MLTLNTLQPHSGAKKSRRRVGRGNSSGHGNYSGRGLKGQKARSGVSDLKRRALRQNILQIPKLRGFHSDKPKAQVVNLSSLNHHFQDGAVIDPQSLVKAKLVKSGQPIKLLARGELKLKNLRVRNLKVSAAAKEQLTKLGGQLDNK
ncbi:50S ribosomal protein L15 [Patescibacteria group bacterium]|jgi:large subunit ribosomal protein L15|nr:50S ribosomal protein L15 [Patescibacteria group bacterium]HPD07609.1 50S ribosomal protein L15 [bacterium]HRT10924.1 50S ribosomal protein L15 [Patescibacteria group bacterium]HRU90098.1 50S ribosomal protein L15 [Patescibacteria group bacterium]